MSEFPHNQIKTQDSKTFSRQDDALMPVSLPESERKAYEKLLESSQDSSPAQWASKNVAAPFLNSAVIDSHNAISSSLNDVSKLVGGSSLLEDWKAYETSNAQLLSKEWLAQNISGAVGAIAPYGLAALGTGLASTKLGGVLKVGAAASAFLHSRSMHLIAGATIYDGMRKPHEGETRFGNALGGAAAFSVFESGNFLSSGTKGLSWVTARMATGALGGAAHLTTSNLISKQELASPEAYANAMISGATLNSLLPKIHQELSNAILPTKAATSQRQGDLAPKTQSADPVPSSLEAARPLQLRGPEKPGGIIPGFVQEHVNRTRARQNEAPAEESHQEGTPITPDKIVTQHRAGGIIPEFMQERIKQTRAKQGEESKAQEPRSTENGSRNKQEQKPVEGTKVEATDADHKEVPFAGSATKQQANAALAEAQVIESSRQRPRVEAEDVDWSAVNATAKVNLLKNLGKELPSDRAKYFDALIDDPDSAVAVAAADALPKLAGTDRFDRWIKISESDNWDLKDKSVALMAHLPKERLPEAFDFILSNADTFLHDPHQLVRLGRINADTPNMQMVSLLQMPELTGHRALKETLWNKAYDNPHTRSSALANIDALPVESHSRIWNQAWEDVSAKGYRQGKADEVNILLAQAKNLSEADLKTAWAKIAQYDGDMTPAQINPLLKGLPEANDVRLNAWRDLLKAVPEESKWDRGVMMAIETLPEHQRSTAWTEAFNALPMLDVNPLAKAIESLPAESRLPAYTKLIESGKELHSWTWNVRSLPAEQLPQLMDAIKKIPDEISRKDMLLSVDLDVLFDKPAAEQHQIAKSVFNKVMNDSVLREGRTLRKWWRQLPEQTNEHGQPQPELRQRLAAELPADGLAQILIPENPELASSLAAKHPNAVRELAAAPKDFFGLDNRRIPEFDNLVSTWLKTDSLAETTDAALAQNMRPEGLNVLPDLMKQVAKESASNKQTEPVLNRLFETIKNPEQDEHTFAKAVEIAAGIGRAHREAYETSFGKSLTQHLSSNETPYAHRLDLARKIAVQQRLGFEGARELSIPDLRLPKIEIPEEARTALREKAESDLRNPAAIQELLGKGELGKRFPMVFGESKDGGIVGRIQHEGHEFTVDKHTIEQLTNIIDDPRFKALSEKEQTDLLWASLFHDSGKRAGISDPGHEWVSANLAWGVLESLGYTPERTSRIATLISRHSELSYWPENPPTRALGEAHNGGTPLARELSVFYRNPAAIDQLTILNTADIKALDGASSKFTAEVAAELQHAKETVSAIQQQMAKPIPLLFTQLPSGFGLHTMPEKFQVLAHATPDEVSFLKNRPSIQSYRSNLSTSLFTREHQVPYQDSNFVVLVTTTPERISTAGPHNLGTGKLVDWKGHVDLSFDKADHKTGWTRAYENWLNQNDRGPKSMEDLFVETTKFDNLNDLAQNGSNKILEAQYKLSDTLTKNADGSPLNSHTEVKANNPHIVGLGIMSKGRPLSFQNMDLQTFERMLAASKKHAWLLGPNEKSTNSLQIPERTWRAVQESGIPLMVLDR